MCVDTSVGGTHYLPVSPGRGHRWDAAPFATGTWVIAPEVNNKGEVVTEEQGWRLGRVEDARVDRTGPSTLVRVRFSQHWPDMSLDSDEEDLPPTELSALAQSHHMDWPVEIPEGAQPHKELFRYNRGTPPRIEQEYACVLTAVEVSEVRHEDGHNYQVFQRSSYRVEGKPALQGAMEEEDLNQLLSTLEIVPDPPPQLCGICQHPGTDMLCPNHGQLNREGEVCTNRVHRVCALASPQDTLGPHVPCSECFAFPNRGLLRLPSPSHRPLVNAREQLAGDCSAADTDNEILATCSAALVVEGQPDLNRSSALPIRPTEVSTTRAELAPLLWGNQISDDQDPPTQIVDNQAAHIIYERIRDCQGYYHINLRSVTRVLERELLMLQASRPGGLHPSVWVASHEEHRTEGIPLLLQRRRALLAQADALAKAALNRRAGHRQTRYFHQMTYPLRAGDDEYCLVDGLGAVIRGNPRRELQRGADELQYTGWANKRTDQGSFHCGTLLHRPTMGPSKGESRGAARFRVNRQSGTLPTCLRTYRYKLQESPNCEFCESPTRDSQNHALHPTECAFSFLLRDRRMMAMSSALSAVDQGEHYRPLRPAIPDLMRGGFQWCQDIQHWHCTDDQTHQSLWVSDRWLRYVFHATGAVDYDDLLQLHEEGAYGRYATLPASLLEVFRLCLGVDGQLHTHPVVQFDSPLLGWRMDAGATQVQGWQDRVGNMEVPLLILSQSIKEQPHSLVTQLDQAVVSHTYRGALLLLSPLHYLVFQDYFQCKVEVLFDFAERALPAVRPQSSTELPSHGPRHGRFTTEMVLLYLSVAGLVEDVREAITTALHLWMMANAPVRKQTRAMAYLATPELIPGQSHISPEVFDAITARWRAADWFQTKLTPDTDHAQLTVTARSRGSIGWDICRFLTSRLGTPVAAHKLPAIIRASRQTTRRYWIERCRLVVARRSTGPNAPPRLSRIGDPTVPIPTDPRLQWDSALSSIADPTDEDDTDEDRSVWSQTGNEYTDSEDESAAGIDVPQREAPELTSGTGGCNAKRGGVRSLTPAERNQRIRDQLAQVYEEEAQRHRELKNKLGEDYRLPPLRRVARPVADSTTTSASALPPETGRSKEVDATPITAHATVAAEPCSGNSTLGGRHKGRGRGRGHSSDNGSGSGSSSRAGQHPLARWLVPQRSPTPTAHLPRRQPAAQQMELDISAQPGETSTLAIDADDYQARLPPGPISRFHYDLVTAMLYPTEGERQYGPRHEDVTWLTRSRTTLGRDLPEHVDRTGPPYMSIRTYHLRQLLPPTTRTYLNDLELWSMFGILWHLHPHRHGEFSIATVSVSTAARFNSGLPELTGLTPHFWGIPRTEVREALPLWLFVPLNTGAHWTHLLLHNGQIEWWDPMRNPPPMDLIQRIYVVIAVRFQMPAFTNRLVTVGRHRYYHQRDGYNCGVYVIMALWNLLNPGLSIQRLLYPIQSARTAVIMTLLRMYRPWVVPAPLASPLQLAPQQSEATGGGTNYYSIDES